MKKLSLVLAFLLLGGTALAASDSAQNPCNPCGKKTQNPCNPCGKKTQNPCNPCAGKSGKSAKVKSGRQTLVGYIGDSQCGLNHPMNMGTDKQCTLKCVGGGSKFILADRLHKVVYTLDDAGQTKAREFPGQKVKITGDVDGKTKAIKVEKIEAA